MYMLRVRAIMFLVRVCAPSYGHGPIVVMYKTMRHALHVAQVCIWVSKASEKYMYSTEAMDN